MATDICLAVQKYSHAISVRSDNTVPWTHLTASDLSVVVKGVNAQVKDDQLTMRIFQGNKALEAVDIASYIDNATVTRRRAEQAGIQLQESQLPIFGMTKDASLALRYQHSDRQPRRLQLRFQSPAECQQVVNVFLHRGMQFQQQRPRTVRPGTGRPTTDSSQNRPLTVQSTSRYFNSDHSPTKPGPFTQHEVLEAGSLSEHRRGPERSPNRSYAQSENAWTGARPTSPPPFLSRDEAAVPREVVSERPTTSQIYRTYTLPSRQSQYNAAHVQDQSASAAPIVERRSSTSQISSLEAIRDAVEQHETVPYDGADIQISSFQGLGSTESWSSAINAPVNTALLSSDLVEPRPPTARPSTAASIPFPDTLEHEIPPRRELPYTRPGSRSSATSLTLPPLPKPNLANEISASLVCSNAVPLIKAPPSRPATASPSKKPSALGPKDPLRPEVAAGVVNKTLSVDAAPKVVMPPPTAPERGMRELLNGRKALQEQSPNTKVPRMNSLADAPHEIDSPLNSPTKVPGRGANSLLEAITSNTQGAAALLHRSQAQTSLDGFAQLSFSDQQQALSDFFVANYENADFLALCEGVENSWRRIVLGL